MFEEKIYKVNNVSIKGNEYDLTYSVYGEPFADGQPFYKVRFSRVIPWRDGYIETSSRRVIPKELAQMINEWLKGYSYKLQNEPSLLALLEAERVFSIEKTFDGNFLIEEGCDGHYGLVFTKEAMLRLGKEIIAMAGEG